EAMWRRTVSARHQYSCAPIFSFFPGGNFSMSRVGRFLRFLMGPALVLALVAGTAGIAAAQTSTAADLEGIVTDDSGAVLPTAKITITNIETGVARSTTSDEGGRYRISALPP